MWQVPLYSHSPHLACFVIPFIFTFRYLNGQAVARQWSHNKLQTQIGASRIATPPHARHNLLTAKKGDLHHAFFQYDRSGGGC